MPGLEGAGAESDQEPALVGASGEAQAGGGAVAAESEGAAGGAGEEEEDEATEVVASEEVLEQLLQVCEQDMNAADGAVAELRKGGVQAGKRTVIPWLGPEFSCRKRVKCTPGNTPVYKPEIRVDFPYK